MNDRITYFGGIDTSSAPHLLKKEDNRRTDPGASLRAICNLWSTTGGLRTRPGLDVKVHFPDNVSIWPDILGNYRPYSGRTRNFSGGTIPWTDEGDNPWDWNDWEEPEEPWSDLERAAKEDLQWRYRNIVLSINQRRFLSGLAASALSTETDDMSVTYVHINDARAAVEDIFDLFVSETVDTMTGVFPYNSLWEILNDAGVGGIPPGGSAEDRSWDNVDAEYKDRYSATLEATDQCYGGFKDWQFSELEKVLRKLRWQSLFMDTNGIWSSAGHGSSFASPDAAWAALGNFQSGYHSVLLGKALWGEPFGDQTIYKSAECSGNNTAKFTVDNIPTLYNHIMDFWHCLKNPVDPGFPQSDYLGVFPYRWEYGNVTQQKQLSENIWAKTKSFDSSKEVKQEEEWDLDWSQPPLTQSNYVTCDYYSFRLAHTKWIFPADIFLGLSLRNNEVRWKRRHKRIQG
ncbi:MAG TPA: hypothetical protein DCZ94_21520 [Lentisphaeria bacterium]|nr:MAG: hypothetical protein A2X48_14450 [Lentisphaerae bacterium GWF2_49_21]HBC89525.1 hypothetical protein [Lentisphaeria bacterium]